MLLAGDSGLLRIEGLPIDRPVPAKSFGSNILCTQHNSALSPIDVCGTEFFTAIRRVRSAFQGNAVGTHGLQVAVNGYDLERWLLKVLIGMACGVLPETKKSWRPPRWWLRVLFGKTDLRDGLGLTCMSRVGEEYEVDPSIGVAPVWDVNSSPKELGGVVARIQGLEFSLLMAPVAKQVGTYRPSVFRFSSESADAQQIVFLGWRRPHGVKTVDIDWSDYGWSAGHVET